MRFRLPDTKAAGDAPRGCAGERVVFCDVRGAHHLTTPNDNEEFRS